MLVPIWMTCGPLASFLVYDACVQEKKTHIGILLFLAALGFITIIDTGAKYMTADLPPLVLVWGYFLGIFASVCVLALTKGSHLPQEISSRRLVLHFGRAGLLVASISFAFIALRFMTLADVTAISFTAPLFITVLAVLFLGEKVDRARWLAVLVGLAGVLIVVRPGSGLLSWGSLLPLLTALTFAGFQIVTRLIATTENTFATLFYTGLFGLIWSSLALPFVWQSPHTWHWLAFLMQGALGVAAHLCMIKAFSLAEASLLAPFNYSKLIWATVAGYIVFGNVPTWNTLAGASVIALAGLFIMMHERRKHE